MLTKFASFWQGSHVADRMLAGRPARLGFHLVIAVLLATAGFAALPFATAHAAGNAIQTENQLPGDPTWNNFAAPSAYDTIAGYASQISVNHGGSIDLFVTTTDQSFDIKIYRTGWYSGAGATLKEDLGVFQGVHYAVPAPDPVTGMIACNWPKVTTLNIPANWVTGVYVAKLTTNANNSSFIFFVVRDDGGHEAIQVQTSVTTYQAYNEWGGLSLYGNSLPSAQLSLYPYAHATKVSFDRPFDSGNGAGHYLWFEYPFVRWAEEQGYDLSYVTDVDTSTGVDPLTDHKAFISLGHDEYWSMGMRQNVQNAINSGVNVAFFSANTCYWQIRFEPNAAGVANRVEVGYKDFAEQTTAPGPDPQWNVNNSIVTTLWRDPVVGMPENALLGIMFEDLDTPAESPYVVSNASSWVFANTGFVNGSTIPGIVGYEYDKTYNNGATPAGLTILSNSPVTGQSVGASHSNSTIYTAPSGARVFAAGTIEWSYGLSNYGGKTYANAGIQQATANILANFTGTTPPSPPTPLPSGTYLKEGFEAGNLNQWTLNSNSTGTLGPETSVVHSGAYAAQFSNATSGSYVTVSQNLAGGAQAQTYTRFYVYLDSTLANSSPTLASATDASGNNLWVIAYDKYSKGLDLYVWNASRQELALYTSANLIQPNSWNEVELQFNESSSGGENLWINGTARPEASTSGNFAVSNKYNTLTLWNDAVGNAYFDDIAVANAPNGPVVPNPTPNANLSAIALTFGNQYVGTPSTAQTATLTNTGTATLTITSIGITGTNPGDFAQTNTCGASLAVGANCTISVIFTPGATGSRTANLNVVDNAPTGSQSASLIGTGTTPPTGMVLSTNSVNFGNQMIGTTSTAQVVTLTNYDATAHPIYGFSFTGSNTGDFSQTNNCGASLAGGASCAINIVFAPTATGSRTAALFVSDTAPAQSATVTLTGTGTPQVPVANVTPNNLNLGTQALTTTSAAQSVTLSNTGLAALSITSITITGTNAGDFAETNTCGTSVAPGASCSINVTFTPLAKGSRSATVNVNDNAAGSPQTVSLVGNGSPQQLPPGVYVMDGFEGGNLSLWGGPNGTGTASVETTVVNSGTDAAALVDASGQYVAIYQDLVGGAQAQTYTRFYVYIPSGTGTTPLANGTDSSGNNLWSVLYDQGRSGLDIYLWNGARTRYDLYSNTNIIQPNTWYDVEIQVNEATAGQGQVWLNGTSIATVSGDLSATNPYSRLYLNNQATGTVYYDDVKVSSSPNGPVGGSAVSLNPTSLTFASQNAGTTSAAQSVTLTNSGTATLNFTSIALAGANPGDFAQTNTCGATLAAGANCTISVTFTPTASGSRAATIQFTDSGFASPQSLALSGTGVAPGVQLNPASLTFASQTTGTTSAAQSVTLTNTGSATLNLNGISLTGTNAGDFAQTNTCGASLTAGANCTISVTFTPTAGGTRSAGVSISDSVAGSPQTVPLTGTGVVPPPPPGTYLVDGFESGNLSGWTGPNGTGQVAAETATVHTGTYAAAITNASGQYAGLNQGLVNTPGALTYTRFYIYLPTGTGTTPIAAGMDASNNNMWVIMYDQGRQGLDIYVWNGARTRYDLYSNTNVLTYNTWYAVEIEMNEVTAGHAEVWLNGTSLAAVDGDLSATNTYTTLSLQNQATGSVYFDDVKVSNAPNGLVSGAAPRNRQGGNNPAPQAPGAAALPKQADATKAGRSTGR